MAPSSILLNSKKTLSHKISYFYHMRKLFKINLMVLTALIASFALFSFSPDNASAKKVPSWISKASNYSYSVSVTLPKGAKNIEISGKTATQWGYSGNTLNWYVGVYSKKKVKVGKMSPKFKVTYIYKGKKHSDYAKSRVKRFEA